MDLVSCANNLLSVSASMLVLSISASQSSRLTPKIRSADMASNTAPWCRKIAWSRRGRGLKCPGRLPGTPTTCAPCWITRRITYSPSGFRREDSLKSSAGEHVGIMLGIALETFAAHGVEVVMATPGVWKAKYRKQLPSMYNATRADIRLQCKRWSRLPTSFVKSAQENAVHCVDATAMAMSYHMGKKDGAPSGLPLKVSRRLLRGMISQ